MAHKRNTSIHPLDRKAASIHKGSPNANHPEFMAKPVAPISLPISKPVESIPSPAIQQAPAMPAPPMQGQPL